MQESLFQNIEDQNGREIHDLGNAVIEEYPAAFSSEQTALLHAAILNSTPWHQDSLMIAGKSIPVPRLQCWMGDAGSLYGYSGIRLVPEPWSDSVLTIKQTVLELTGLKFNSVLINLYRNGLDSVAWHADDEDELGSEPVIASLSLGAEREFQLCPKHSSSRAVKARLKLRDGSLLVMGKSLQNNWLHQVPKEKSIKESRINLTFRNIESRPVIQQR